MIVAGVDPGYDRLGVAVFEEQKLIYSNCFTSHPKDDFASRLNTIAEQLEKIIIAYQIKEVAVEELYFSKNQTTALKVAEARGVINYLARKNGAAVHQYSPQAVKIAVAGYGNANKEQVMAMVKRLVQFPTPPKYDDEYDAVAVGLTHLARRRAI